MRKPLERFANAMEQKLREHDQWRGERGWRSENVGWLIDRAEEEIAELKGACLLGPDDRAKEEAVDVANFMMFIYDILSGEPEGGEDD